MPEDTNNKNTNGGQEEQYENETPGLLPPHALPTPPPPPPEQDSSTLTSPWWSEEPPTEPTPTTTTAEAEAEPLSSQQDTTRQEKENKIVNMSVLSFRRSSPKDSATPWKERCFLVATTNLSSERIGKENVQKELEDLFDNSKHCSMVCFLRSSRELTRERLLKENDGKLPITFSINPFYGTWLSIASTPARCKEHLLNVGDIQRKSFSDYSSIELGEELSRSGEHVTGAVKKTFSPLHHLTQRYIDSWKDGNQQAFFSKFWSSAQKGDAFYLVLDSTKRLVDNALGHDKKK